MGTHQLAAYVIMEAASDTDINTPEMLLILNATQINKCEVLDWRENGLCGKDKFDIQVLYLQRRQLLLTAQNYRCLFSFMALEHPICTMGKCAECNPFNMFIILYEWSNVHISQILDA